MRASSRSEGNRRARGAGTRKDGRPGIRPGPGPSVRNGKDDHEPDLTVLGETSTVVHRRPAADVCVEEEEDTAPAAGVCRPRKPPP